MGIGALGMSIATGCDCAAAIDDTKIIATTDAVPFGFCFVTLFLRELKGPVYRRTFLPDRGGCHTRSSADARVMFRQGTTQTIEKLGLLRPGTTHTAARPWDPRTTPGAPE